MNGWILLAPAGLMALAALAIPILIHLLSRSRGQRVLVGNIELFRQVRRQRASQIRLVQWLLLLLRLLMLLTAALLLADLARQGLAPAVDNTAYITPARLAAIEQGEAPLPANSSYDQLVALDDGWAQLSEALAIQRHEGDVPVYTLASADDRPARPLALPSPVTWRSEGAGAARAPATLNVLVVYDPERLADAQALQAATRSVNDFRDLSLNVQLAALDDSVLTRTDMPEEYALVWLSELPVPVDNGAAVLIEDAQNRTNSSTNLTAGFVAIDQWPGLNFLAAGDATDQLPGRAVLWRDVAGQALLVEHDVDGQRQLRFTQRLSLNANNPLAQDRWPDMLARLLLGETEWRTGTAHASLPVQQAPLTTPPLNRGQPARSTIPFLSVLLALLFITERWLAERPRKDPASDE